MKEGFFQKTTDFHKQVVRQFFNIINFYKICL